MARIVRGVLAGLLVLCAGCATAHRQPEPRLSARATALEGERGGVFVEAALACEHCGQLAFPKVVALEGKEATLTIGDATHCHELKVLCQGKWAQLALYAEDGRLVHRATTAIR